MSLGLSNSEMKQWRRCPRQWYLGTYRRLTNNHDEEPGAATWIGNLVHDALAHYYDPASNLGDPVGFAQARLEEQIAGNPAMEAAYRKEFGLVEAMLIGYVEWLEETGADSDLVFEGSERMVRIALKDAHGEPTGVTLLSKLDAPVKRISTGERLALEHKTVASLDQPKAGLRLDTQLLTEHLARFLAAKEQGMTNEEAYASCVGIFYNMLRKVKRTSSAKPPFYDRLTVPHNLNELRAHWTHVHAIAAQIAAATARLDAGESHHTVCPPNPMPDRCKWDCDFYRVCPLADDGSHFDVALSELYVEHDPLERYADAEEL